MTDQVKAKELLKEDLEDKKTYDAKYDANCSTCSNKIYQGDQFIFMGDKRKMCLTCKMTLQDLIEERL